MRIIYLVIVFVLMTSYVGAQQKLKKVGLEEIWGGKFSQEYINDIQSMNDGEFYTILEYGNGGTSIDKYSYSSFKKISTIVNGADLEDAPFFTSYTFSADEKQILLATEATAIYRHSYTAKHYLYNIASKTLKEISSGVEQEPTFSADGKKIAYVRDNNIYVVNIADGTEIQLTSDGKKNEIINGITDWVYEEEFAFVRAFEWSPDSKYISYLKFDEKEVPEISMDIFGTTLYPDQLKFKYPKAGENNSKVSLHIYSFENDSSIKANIEEGDFYIPRMKWNKQKHSLSYVLLNRHQNDLKLNLINASSMKEKTLIHEKSETYIDVNDNLTFLVDNSFIWTSEKDGFNHIYLYNSVGTLVKQVTKGNWEVSSLYGYDVNSKRLFYQSTENGSINRAIYSIKLNGKSKRELSVSDGTNRAIFSNNYKYYINTFSDANSPNVYSLNKASNGKVIKVIEDNAVLRTSLSSYNLTEKKFLTIKTEEGVELNAWMMKPKDFDPTKEYPVFMYVYGGPGSQTVQNSWAGANYMWFQILADKGYIVVSVDNRGTGGKGAAFKKATYKELGKYEIVDQINSAKYLGSLPYVDKERIGMFGWSFGGYMTSLAMTKGADIFKMGIAVAPVTNWRFYDSVYTERYMQTPQENESGYDSNSPINYVSKLKGAYLLVHGSADDNVHYQNTMRMVESLVQANKQFDLFIYPDKNHGIYGGNTRLHLYTKMTKFIEDNL